MLVLGVFLAFVQLRLVPAWMVLIIVFREVLITGVRLYAASRNIVLPAAREGKHKTVSQMAAIIVILVGLVIRELWAPEPLPPGAEAAITAVILGCLWVTTILTVVSGTLFFWRHREVLRDAVSR